MLLNIYTIVAAMLIGLLTGWVAIGLLRRGRTSPVVVIASALMVACIGNVFASFLALGITGLDAFAVMHVTYLWGTLGLPVAAALTLAFDRGRSKVIMASGLATLLLAPLGLYMTHIEPFWLRVDRVELTTPGVGTPFKIGVLSDLQTPSIGNYENDAIAELISLEPDVVLVPGDLYQIPSSDWEKRLPEFQEMIRHLTANVPLVVLVNGNTDRVDGLRRITEGTDAVLLDNESTVVEIYGNQVQIVGITLFGDDVAAQRAVDSSRSVDADMTILLAHQPDEIRWIRDEPMDLLVAGHTHGGQISFPFVGPPLTLTSVPQEIAAGGLHTLYGTPIYVSTGVGRERSHAPQIRLGVRPSIGLIEVDAAP